MNFLEILNTLRIADWWKLIVANQHKRNIVWSHWPNSEVVRWPHMFGQFGSEINFYSGALSGGQGLRVCRGVDQARALSIISTGCPAAGASAGV